MQCQKMPRLGVAGVELQRSLDALLVDEHGPADRERLLELRAAAYLDDFNLGHGTVMRPDVPSVHPVPPRRNLPADG